MAVTAAAQAVEAASDPTAITAADDTAQAMEVVSDPVAVAASESAPDLIAVIDTAHAMEVVSNPIAVTAADDTAQAMEVAPNPMAVTDTAQAMEVVSDPIAVPASESAPDLIAVTAAAQAVEAASDPTAITAADDTAQAMEVAPGSVVPSFFDSSAQTSEVAQNPIVITVASNLFEGSQSSGSSNTSEDIIDCDIPVIPTPGSSQIEQRVSIPAAGGGSASPEQDPLGLLKRSWSAVRKAFKMPRVVPAPASKLIDADSLPSSQVFHDSTPLRRIQARSNFEDAARDGFNAVLSARSSATVRDKKNADNSDGNNDETTAATIIAPTDADLSKLRPFCATKRVLKAFKRPTVTTTPVTKLERANSIQSKYLALPDAVTETDITFHDQKQANDSTVLFDEHSDLYSAESGCIIDLISPNGDGADVVRDEKDQHPSIRYDDTTGDLIVARQDAQVGDAVKVIKLVGTEGINDASEDFDPSALGLIRPAKKKKLSVACTSGLQGTPIVSVAKRALAVVSAAAAIGAVTAANAASREDAH
jgi:hypothetical protein